MAALTTQQIGPAGLAPTYAAASAGGDTAETGDTVFLHVKNASGGAITVTVDSVAPCNQGADHDLVVSVPATTGDRMIGPLISGRFAQPSSGRANITYSGVTSLTVAVIRF